MRRQGDDKTGDLFQIPEADIAPAEMDYRAPVSGLVSKMLKHTDSSRTEVAARCSDLSGREISKAMLDAYSSEGRETFNLPFCLVPVLEVACESFELSNWLAAVRGGRLLVGRDPLAGELARLERQRHQTSQRITALRKVMEVT